MADYSEPALNAFREATGITDVPRKAGDRHWFEFMEFHRDTFRKYLEEKFKDELTSYVKEGGNLLLVGPKTAALFQSQLGVTLEGAPAQEPLYLEFSESLTPTKGETQTVELGPKAEPFGRLHLTNDLNSVSQTAASIAQFGRGKIAATYFLFGRGYLSTRSEVARGFLNELARKLFPAPVVEVQGSSDVDVVVNRIGGKLAVNLVNTVGPHEQEPIVDSIPMVGPLHVTIRQLTEPAKVTLEPGGKRLAFDYRLGEIKLTLPRLEIHDIIVVE